MHLARTCYDFSPPMSVASPGVSPADAKENAAGPASNRLMSLDIFRGLTVAAMIVVNNPGSEDAFAPLKHSAWNGCTFTDLVFPFFLFIVGVSLTFSVASRMDRGESRGRLMTHVLRRGATLFALGLFLNGAWGRFQLSTWRVK